MNPPELENENIEQFCLSADYSTTRLVACGKQGFVRKPEDNVESISILLGSEGEKSVGGLRTRGYFKAGSPEKPLITIVTVVFNGQASLEKTILSVIRQSYDNVEFIIIDGGSKDGTVDIIRKYEDVIDYWVSESDSGIYDAMNKGANLSTGDWLNFMNGGDDFYSESMIEKVRAVLVPGKVVFGRTKVIDSEGRSWDYPSKKIVNSNMQKWLKAKYPNHQSMFFPKSYYKCNKYDLSYPISADSHYKNKSLKELGFVFYDGFVANFYTGGISTNPKIKPLLAICHERFNRNDFKYRHLDYFLCAIKAAVKVGFYKVFGEKSFSLINKVRSLWLKI